MTARLPNDPVFVDRVRHELAVARENALELLHRRPGANNMGRGRLSSEAQLAEFARQRREGRALADIARPVWEDLGYPSLEAACSAIRSALKARGVYTFMLEKPRRRGRRRKLSGPAAEARRMYEVDGDSLFQIAHGYWEEWGYKSWQSCEAAIRKAWRMRGLEIRDRSEAQLLAIEHGRSALPKARKASARSRRTE